MTVWPPISAWRSHSPPLETDNRLTERFRYRDSSFSNFDSMTDAIGLNSVIWTIPTRSAMPIAGVSNCHAEIPAARDTTNSFAFDSRQKARVAPNRTQNGSICCNKWGSLNRLI